MLSFILTTFQESWKLLNQASLYILFGIAVGGMLKIFLSPAYVTRHLGRGRYSSVFKAAILGIPIPLCSCSVLPAGASLKKQGANNGATMAFLIATPESGVDSISISWALLDPIMTVARPISAFISAFFAGIAENLFHPPQADIQQKILPLHTSSSCCDDSTCTPEEHSQAKGFSTKILNGLHYAATELWGDLAGWFFVGIVMAGIVTTLLPETFFSQYLGGGLSSMLLMLLVGIPIYICATASTPIAAAFLAKGVSPGTALVFLLVGPATNITSLSVLIGILGKRATTLYLVMLSSVAVLCGLLLDFIYFSFNISILATIGQTAEILPQWLTLIATIFLLGLSIQPVMQIIRKWLGKDTKDCGCDGSCSA